MKVGILSDELSPVPAMACEMAALYGIRYLELRGWYRHRAPLGMTEKDMREVREAADAWGLRFGSISPGLFKVPADSPEVAAHTGDFFAKCLDLCEVLGAKMMVSFTPIVPEERRGQWSPQLVEDFRALGEQAQARGITIAVENEPVCVASSAPLVARLVAEVNHPAVGSNWDPGNDAFSGQSTGPQSYPLVAPHLRHVHVKDYLPGQHQVVDLGEGGADWRWILAQLKQAGYSGFLILEPHGRPQLTSTQRAVLALRRRLAEIGVEW
jgi:sugar phosphate isomerase/epimerase